MTRFRIVFAVALVLHGLAHASAGMWATDIGGRGLVTVLWEGATAGFMAAAAGLLGVRIVRRWWRALVVVASLSSLALLLLYSHPLFVIGIGADFVMMALALAPAAGGQLTRLSPVPRGVRMVIAAFTLYVAIAIGVRPLHSSWGTTRSEQQMVLAGDPPLGEPHYRIDHAVSIRAPADSVWPWLVQAAQARGWRVKEIKANRVLLLEKRRALVLEPAALNATRLHIRTRGEGIPTLPGIAMTPLALLILEPAHFITERGMMLGIKARAEGREARAPN